MKLEVWIKCKAGAGKKHDNPGAILIEYVRDGESTCGRSLRHKGFEYLTKRVVSDDEVSTEVPVVQYRHKWTTYTNWSHFIQNEKLFELPEGWLEELDRHRKTYSKLDQMSLNIDTGLIEFV